ncbi:hypothetical protein [Rubeoparvulum massiliense]|uniref:hypothetical protein n=1 Tax=Rubeoparvulum massiliense TaxID=1631346 RepID=UPI00065E76C5|nr:hypothetical protein [Rubeoparvulum massiliense]
MANRIQIVVRMTPEQLWSFQLRGSGFYLVTLTLSFHLLVLLLIIFTGYGKEIDLFFLLFMLQGWLSQLLGCFLLVLIYHLMMLQLQSVAILIFLLILIMLLWWLGKRYFRAMDIRWGE